MAIRATREQVLAFRVRAQQLDRTGRYDDAAILDLGVQDTGTGGASWALANRGCVATDTFLAWTLRGAPHLYRRAEAAQVAAAVAPWSDADAAKRIFDAAKPLKAAGIPIRDALGVVAATMRDIVTTPTPKGEMSAELTRRLDPPYLRRCVPCDATHTYEQPFRLAALQAGLELEPGTSPPVLRRLPRWKGPAKVVPEHLDVVRGVLRFLGPATPVLVAGYVDSPVKEVAAHWPTDTVTVDLDGEERQILEADLALLRSSREVVGVRLLGPFDLFLQSRDRELIVPDAAARKDLWRTLGRPGAVLVDGEVVGSWRPKATGKSLTVQVTIWSGAPVPDGLEEQAQTLATHRGLALAGVRGGA